MIENVTARRYSDCAGAVLYWCGFTVAAQISWAFNKPTVSLYLLDGFEKFLKMIVVDKNFDYDDLIKELKEKITQSIVHKYYPEYV